MKKALLRTLCLLLALMLPLSGALSESVPSRWLGMQENIAGHATYDLDFSLDAERLDAYIQRQRNVTFAQGVDSVGLCALVNHLRLRVYGAGSLFYALVQMDENPLFDFTLQNPDGSRVLLLSALMPGYALDCTASDMDGNPSAVSYRRIREALPEYADYDFLQEALDAGRAVMEELEKQGLAQRYENTLYYKGDPQMPLNLLTDGSLSLDPRTEKLIRYLRSNASGQLDMLAGYPVSITHTGDEMGVMIDLDETKDVPETEAPDENVPDEENTGDAVTAYAPDSFIGLRVRPDQAMLEVKSSVYSDTTFVISVEDNGLRFTKDSMTSFFQISDHETTEIALEMDDQGMVFTLYRYEKYETDLAGSSVTIYVLKEDDTTEDFVMDTKESGTKTVLRVSGDLSALSLTVAEVVNEEELPPFFTLTGTAVDAPPPEDIPSPEGAKILSFVDATSDDGFMEIIKYTTEPTLVQRLRTSAPEDARSIVFMLVMALHESI